MDRVANDYYPTPHTATAALFKVAGHLFRDNQLIFDPCAGHGAILNSAGQIKPSLQLLGNEPFPPLGVNFPYKFDASIEQNWHSISHHIDWVITKPPYAKELQLPILDHSYRFAVNGLAALVRLSWLEPCSDRRHWLQENADQLRHIVFVHPRPISDESFCWVIYNKSWSWKEKSQKNPFQFLGGS